VPGMPDGPRWEHSLVGLALGGDRGACPLVFSVLGSVFWVLCSWRGGQGLKGAQRPSALSPFVFCGSCGFCGFWVLTHSHGDGDRPLEEQLDGWTLDRPLAPLPRSLHTLRSASHLATEQWEGLCLGSTLGSCDSAFSPSSVVTSLAWSLWAAAMLRGRGSRGGGRVVYGGAQRTHP